MPPKVIPIQPVSSTKSGIYLHFPYCLQKCHYCDFFSVGLDELPGADFSERLRLYEESLNREMEIRAADPDFASQHFDSIYFGGGTSSMMPPEMIERILFRLKELFSVDSPAEITLEGNPENLVPEYLEALSNLGINRVNSGLQTYNSNFLKDMNRFFDTQRYAGLLEALTACSIPSVGVDLIYGFHGQTYEEFARDLEKVLRYRIQHLSVYSLTVEPETRYARHINRGSQGAPNEGLQEKVFSNLPGLLKDKGFHQYEISNYSAIGEICKHNWKYWDYRPYLGLGPGAHGFNGQIRYANPRNLNAWTSSPGRAQSSEAHNPIIDLFLNIFRITVPIRLDRIREIWDQQSWTEKDRKSRWSALMNSLEKMDREKLGNLKKETFQWSLAGLQLLDTQIERLVEATLQPEQ